MIMTKLNITSVTKDSPGAGQVTIVGTYAEEDVSLVAAQQYTIPNYTDENPNWSRINRHTGDNFIVRRNGVTQSVAVDADGLNKIAYGIESSLSFAPIVLTQPPATLDVEIGVDADIQCSIGSELDATYQWQISVNNSTWSNVADGAEFSGAATQSLTLSLIDDTYNSYYFRCVGTNSLGSVNTTSCQILVSF